MLFEYILYLSIGLMVGLMVLFYAGFFGIIIYRFIKQHKEEIRIEKELYEYYCKLYPYLTKDKK